MGKTLQAPKRRGFSTIGPRPVVEPPRRTNAKGADAPAEAAAPTTTGVPGVTAARALPDTPTVSVICPTYNRPAMHEKLYDIFRKQDYAAKDLWILDDTHASSAFFSKITDPDVHYVHTPQKRTIGAKRNQLIALSAGSIIAHFDDDDWYAPNYLSSMVAALLHHDADFVKLASWQEFRQADGHRRLFDARRQKHANMWGWGFSYLYRRYVATLVRFPNLNNGEDYAFVQGLHTQGLQTVQVEGGSEWIEHLLHGRNVSRKE
jgi:cellulose synthase/poly-beta-1,6-N-acetylglucosamine synthase-like glycosyltransferase